MNTDCRKFHFIYHNLIYHNPNLYLSYILFPVLVSLVWTWMYSKNGWKWMPTIGCEHHFVYYYYWRAKNIIVYIQIYCNNKFDMKFITDFILMVLIVRDYETKEKLISHWTLTWRLHIEQFFNFLRIAIFTKWHFQLLQLKSNQYRVGPLALFWKSSERHKGPLNWPQIFARLFQEKFKFYALHILPNQPSLFTILHFVFETTNFR